MTERSALYRAFDGDKLLYVGSSYCPWKRFAQHLGKSPWAKSATRVEIEWFDSRDEALEAEMIAISVENPESNRDGYWALGAGSEYGRCLSDWIFKKGLRRSEFAELVGCHPSTISNTISGKMHPTENLINSIIKHTNGEVRFLRTCDPAKAGPQPFHVQA